MTDYLEVGKEPLRLEEDLILLEGDRCVIKAHKGTLAVPLLQNDKTVGYVFHGEGELLLDAIIETPEGAVGKPIEHKLENPFLMVCPPEKAMKIKEKLGRAETEEVMQKGYREGREFAEVAEELCFRMFKNSRLDCSPNRQGYIFGFKKANSEKLDILVSKKDKLAYICGKNVFVFKKGKSVIIKPGEVLIAKNEHPPISSKHKLCRLFFEW